MRGIENMKTKIVGINKEKKFLTIAFKKPLFKNMCYFRQELVTMFYDDDSYIGVYYGEKDNVLEVKLKLRNKEDIEPYKTAYNKKEMSILSKYDYAILVTGCNTKFVNNGRVEHVKALYFENQPDYIPELKIYK